MAGCSHFTSRMCMLSKQTKIRKQANFKLVTHLNPLPSGRPHTNKYNK